MCWAEEARSGGGIISSLASSAGFDVTDARVLAVNGYPVQRQPSAPSQAAQQPVLGAPAAAPDTAPRASNIPAARAAYAILGMQTSTLRVTQPLCPPDPGQRFWHPQLQLCCMSSCKVCLGQVQQLAPQAATSAPSHCTLRFSAKQGNGCSCKGPHLATQADCKSTLHAPGPSEAYGSQTQPCLCRRHNGISGTGGPADSHLLPCAKAQALL